MSDLVLDHPERLFGLPVLLLVLYLLARPARPRQRLATAHLAQWQAALQALGRRRVRFRALRFWLLALAASAAAVAAAGPRYGVVDGPRELCVLLDASASMAAREPDGAPTAWDAACAHLATALAEVPRGVDLRLALAADGAVEVRRGAPAELIAALPAAPAPDARDADLAELARALLATSPQPAVWTLTDARGATAPATAAGGVRVFGSPRPNAGVVDAEIDDAWPLPELTLRLWVFGAAGDAASQLRLAGGAEARAQPVQEAAGPELQRLVWRLRRTAGGPLELWLPDGGALAADDRVVFELPAPPAPDIAVLGGGELIERAARALAELGGGRVAAQGSPGLRASLALSDGGRQRRPAARQFAFGTEFGPLDGPASAREPARIVDWDREHPLTAGVDWSEVEVRAALPPAALPADCRGLVWAADGPLVAVRTSGGARSIHTRFRLADSNLALLPAFPQLLRRGFVWLHGERARPRLVRAGPLDRAESDLGRVGGIEAGVYAPLPALADPGVSLAIPSLVLALLALAARAWT